MSFPTPFGNRLLVKQKKFQLKIIVSNSKLYILVTQN